MLRPLAYGLGGVFLIWIIPYLLGAFAGLAILSAPFYFLDQTLGLHFATDKPSLMSVEALGVQWEGGDTKSVQIRVTNKSGEPWSQFTLSCSSNIGEINMTDQSGILPDETGVRSYSVSDPSASTINRVSNCVVEQHMRGKPHAFDAYNDRLYDGGGGWGDRLPDGRRPGMMTMDAIPSSGDQMSSSDTMSGGTGNDYIPANGIMDSDTE